MYYFPYLWYNKIRGGFMKQQENLTMSVGQLTSKFQVTIPKVVREALDIQDRDKIAFVLNDRGEIVIQKVVRC